MCSVRIGFIPLSSSRSPLPSTRISVFNMFPYLRDAGFVPEVAHEPERESTTPDLDGIDAQALARRFDLVYIQKAWGASVLRLVNRLEAAGVRTVYGVCDVVEPAMVEATSATAVVTEHLRRLYPAELQAKMHVVHDGIEAPERQKQQFSERRGTRADPLRAVLVTSDTLVSLPVIGRPPPWLRVFVVGAYAVPMGRGERLRRLHWAMAHRPLGERIRLASQLLDRRIARVPWDPVGVYEQMDHADIGIIPVDPDGPAYWQLKSENRLTLKMSVGLPVIASPVPAYEPVARHGYSALFARSREEWLQHLEALRDPALRRAMGERARAAVLPRYSKEAQAQALIRVLQAALERAPAVAAR